MKRQLTESKKEVNNSTIHYSSASTYWTISMQYFKT